MECLINCLYNNYKLIPKIVKQVFEYLYQTKYPLIVKFMINF